MRDSDLDDLFAAARKAAPDAPAALLARVLTDAETHQPRPMVRRPVARPRFWAVLLAALGGTGALAGLATATLAGVWIGFAQPAPVTTVTEAIWVTDTEATLDLVELIPSLDTFLTEG